MICENGVCVPPCGIPGPVTGDCIAQDSGTPLHSEDCNWCGGSEQAHGTWQCRKPNNANGPTDHGKCNPAAAGCSDLGTGVAVLPDPWNDYTQLCSHDTDCTDSNVGMQYDVGQAIRSLVGSDKLNLGFTQLTICTGVNFTYAMDKCAPIQITQNIACGLCVPCAQDSDCVPIPIDPLLSGLFCQDPLAAVAGAILVDLLWGDQPDHNLNFFCQQVVAGYGVCIPCGNPT
jgi:hypothetical protein